jgi:hypothetical protein
MGVEKETGLWKCHRCHESGKVSEHWEQRAPATRTQQKNAARRRAFDVPPLHQEPKTPRIENAQELGVPIEDAPAAMDYLIHRGLPSSVVISAGVRYVANWYGRPAIVFPMRDEHGHYVAANGRYIHSGADPKAKTRGPVSDAVFGCFGALKRDTLAITEAPLDALTLAMFAIPSIALCGTNPPTWLRRKVCSTRIILATDNDDAGNKAADALAGLLAPMRSRVERIIPAYGVKDWNELLMEYGAVGVGAVLRRHKLYDCQRIDAPSDEIYAKSI